VEAERPSPERCLVTGLQSFVTSHGGHAQGVGCRSCLSIPGQGGQGQGGDGGGKKGDKKGDKKGVKEEGKKEAKEGGSKGKKEETEREGEGGCQGEGKGEGEGSDGPCDRRQGRPGPL